MLSNILYTPTEVQYSNPARSAAQQFLYCNVPPLLPCVLFWELREPRSGMAQGVAAVATARCGAAGRGVATDR